MVGALRGRMEQDQKWAPWLSLQRSVGPGFALVLQFDRRSRKATGGILRTEGTWIFFLLDCVACRKKAFDMT